MMREPTERERLMLAFVRQVVAEQEAAKRKAELCTTGPG